MKLKLFVSALHKGEAPGVNEPRSTGSGGSERALSKFGSTSQKVKSQRKPKSGERERWRKSVAKYASPSCIKKNGCKVKKDLEGTANHDGMRIRYEVSTLVAKFMQANKNNVSEWISQLSNDELVLVPNVFFTERIQNDAEDLLRTFRQIGRASCRERV